MILLQLIIEFNHNITQVQIIILALAVIILREQINFTTQKI